MGDADAYLNSCINTKFSQLTFSWKSTCSACSLNFDTFEAFLEHVFDFHCGNNDNYPCVLENCGFSSLNPEHLARHVILKHANFESLQVYSRCLFCRQSFSTLPELNKHSCCAKTLKKQPGKMTKCEDCQREFSTNKRYTFHMQFHNEEARPQVCLICEATFSESDAMFEHVHYEHPIKGEFGCKQCDRIYKDEVKYESHVKSHSKPFKFACNLCSKKYNYKHLLDSHQEIYHKGAKWPCTFCDKSYVTEEKLIEHQRIHDSDTSLTVYSCAECGLVAHDAESLMCRLEAFPCHLKDFSQETVNAAYVCEYGCGDFKTLEHLLQHRGRNLHSDGVYHCNYCEFKFMEYKKLRLHVKTHPTYQKLSKTFLLPRYYTCDFENCLETFPVWASLAKHKLIHSAPSQPTNLQCSFCERYFKTKMSLSIHIARSHNNHAIDCVYCKVKLKSDEELKDHIERLHEEVQCPHCEKVICNRRYLERHIQVVHSNEKRFFCKHCGKGYVLEYECNAHQQNVHGSVAYQCTTCKFQTRYLKSLHIHLAAHRQVRPHRCTLCGKSFSRKRVLVVHIQRHEQQRKEFLCSNHVASGCSAIFSSESLLYDHIDESHSDWVPAAKRSKSQLETETDSHPDFIKGLDYIEVYDESQVLMDDAERLDNEEHVDDPAELVTTEESSSLSEDPPFVVLPPVDAVNVELVTAEDQPPLTTGLLKLPAFTEDDIYVDYSGTIEELLNECEDYTN